MATEPTLLTAASGAIAPDAAVKSQRGREGWLNVGLFVVLIMPLVVAVIGLRRPTWFPVLDLAMTELRVRDVGTARTPLIGLPGRIGRSLVDQGSHPGPLSFYALAPTYRLLGSTAWAMQVAAVVVQAVAVAACLLIARRRGGMTLVLAVAAILAVLMRGYGVSVLTEPWNPYLPVLWWVVLLLAVWSVLADDVAMLPVAVVAASFCAQTHVPYVPVAAGMGAVVALATAAAFRRHTSGPRHGAVLRWVALAAGIGFVLWLPPLVDQVVQRPGNVSRLAQHFSDPPETAVGAGAGLRLTLEHLDLRALVPSGGNTGWMIAPETGDRAAAAPGLVLALVWCAAAVASWRMRRADLLQLHAVVAAGLGFGLIAMARIFGNLWYYLTLWGWGVTALLVLAVGQTVAAAVARRLVGRPARPRAATAGAACMAAVVLLSAGLFARDAADAPPPATRLSSTLGALIDPTVAALDDGVLGSTGRAGRYVVTWEDALHIGSQAYGLVNELERRGFDVGMMPNFRAPLTPYRVVAPGEAVAEIHFATGVNIEPWRSMPNAVEVAFADPRSAAERAEFDALRVRAIAALERDGLDDVVPLVDTNLFGAAISTRVPDPIRKLLGRMLDLGEPSAVFLAPPGTTP